MDDRSSVRRTDRRGLSLVRSWKNTVYRTWCLVKFLGALLVILALIALVFLGSSYDRVGDSATGKATSVHSSTHDNNPSGYNTLFYDPEPRELTPAQEAELMGGGTSWLKE